MADEQPNNPAAPELSAADAKMIEDVAQFTKKLVNTLTETTIPFPIIVQLLMSNAATICVYNDISRGQFMELARVVFSQIQAMNKSGIVKDEPKIVVASK